MSSSLTLSTAVIWIRRDYSTPCIPCYPEKATLETQFGTTLVQFCQAESSLQDFHTSNMGVVTPLLLLLLIRVRSSPSLDSTLPTATGDHPHSIRFAPSPLRLSSLDVIATVQRPSHLSLWIKSAPLLRLLICWILVCAGDIEINPGPGVNYPCTSCNSSVRTMT